MRSARHVTPRPCPQHPVGQTSAVGLPVAPAHTCLQGSCAPGSALINSLVSEGPEGTHRVAQARPSP